MVTMAESITSDEFARLLKQYPALIKDMSSKPLKPGQKSLEELDEYRYVKAIQTFSLPSPKRDMTLDDIKALVEWKLRHGKFRPTLMNLVSSNAPQTATDTVKRAFTEYKSPKDIDKCLATLCELRGIGPATASLLLAVRDPSNVLFFSDEAFWWLCCGGKRDQIKYSNKEYELLRGKAAALVKRLGVDATDVEKVAYVSMKSGDTAVAGTASKSSATQSGVKSLKRKDTEDADRKDIKGAKDIKDVKGTKDTKDRKETKGGKEDKAKSNPSAGTRQSKRIKR